MGNGLIVDGYGCITTFNSAAENLTGILAEEALNQKADMVRTSRSHLRRRYGR